MHERDGTEALKLILYVRFDVKVGHDCSTTKRTRKKKIGEVKFVISAYSAGGIC